MTTEQRLFLDIHAIQTLPPSNMNRDDTGSPKTAQYGGVRRSRVSSQSWKKAMREYFNTHGDQSNVGIRTKEIVRYVADKIVELDSSISIEDVLEKADKVLIAAGIKKKGEVKALYFMGDSQAKKLAQAAYDNITDKKNSKSWLMQIQLLILPCLVEWQLKIQLLTQDSSSQVAHAISTHPVQTEFDFFTAVDDLAPKDNAGAGMLGTVEFNSSTLYRYANVAIHELSKQLGNKESLDNSLSCSLRLLQSHFQQGK